MDPSAAPIAIKQGFRFNKSGSVSPIPPPQAPPSSSSSSSSSLSSSSSSSAAASSPGQQQQRQLPLPTLPSLDRVPSHPSLISESFASIPAASVSALNSGYISAASLGGGDSSSTAPTGVDAKLYHIVKRIVQSTPSLLITSAGTNKASQQSRKNNAQAVTSIVLEKHREYRRKELTLVRTGVDGALFHLGETDSFSTNGKKRRASAVVSVGGGSNSIINDCKNNPIGDDLSFDGPKSPFQKKRHIVDAGGSVELSPTAEENNTCSKSRTLPLAPPTSESQTLPITPSNSGGMLNASLRNRYRDVQREREKEQLLLAAEDQSNSTRRSNAEDESSLFTNDNVVAAEDVTAIATAGCFPISPNDITAPNNPVTTPPSKSSASTPRKKKKTKKTPASNIHRASQGDDGGPFYSSNSGALLQPSPRPTERYSDLGGISPLLQQLRELIEYPLSRPELFLHLGVEPPRGVLLRGPPGCGKTHLARAIAGELNVGYYQVSAPELVGGVSGESEMRVRTLFESASDNAPAIIFIDEIDSIAPKRGEGSGGGGRGMEKRIVAQLLTSMDSIHPKNTRNGSAVMVLGATNRPDAMDPALRRAGRFDREIVLGAPDEKAREGILRAMTRGMRVADDLNYSLLARKTPGYVGADVRSLLKEAAVIAINRIFQTGLLGGDIGGDGVDGIARGSEGEQRAENEEALSHPANSGTAEEETNYSDRLRAAITGDKKSNDDGEIGSRNDVRSVIPLTSEQLQPLYVTMSDFLLAIPHVQPSAKREGFATVPDVSWGDIGALASIREELTLSVLEPISHPERFEALGLCLPAGVLLYGPPGCGKTLLAKAIAKESGANFISVKGPELLDKYVGESERAVRVVFERARSSSPCIIFFDELDSLCPKRGSDGGSGGGGVSERVVNQLLTEMDGLDSRRSVFVIAATNRPELIDPAMLRPGRLDKLLYVPLPSSEERYSILCALSKKVKLAADVDLHAIAHNPHAHGFSGADCAALLREAGLAVLRDGMLRRTDPKPGNDDGEVDDDKNNVERKTEPPLQITAHHFLYAFEHVLPSVSTRDQARYDKLRDRMAQARTRGGVGSSPSSTGGGSGDVSDVEKNIE